MSNKTSDKNVANIEDDVKILNNFCEYEDAVVLTDYALTLVQEAIEHILAEREQMLKEREKYTIRLTDEEYRKVIENAQRDTSNDTVIAHKFAVMQQQIEQKDKRINLMAERIEWLCKSNGILLDKEHDENFTQEDVKQYFERKVEDVG